MKWRTFLFVSADVSEGINQPFAPIATPALRKAEELLPCQDLCLVIHFHLTLHFSANQWLLII